MIIICPSCEKKFEIDSNLIPDKGRLLKCGSCDQKWFFNRNNQENINTENVIPPISELKKKTSFKPQKIKKKIVHDDMSRMLNNSGTELVKYQSQSKFTFLKFLSYILVAIISFVGLILILDTFKSPFYDLFPNLEFFLFSLYETLKDVELFIKDLI